MLTELDALMLTMKLRTKYFDDDLFFDPAWAILIDLYQAGVRGRKLSVKAVCKGSGVPDTTALRYVKTLEERGHIRRDPDERDRRRAYLRLSRSANARMEQFFNEVGRRKQKA